MPEMKWKKAKKMTKRANAYKGTFQFFRTDIVSKLIVAGIGSTAIIITSAVLYNSLFSPKPMPKEEIRQENRLKVITHIKHVPLVISDKKQQDSVFTENTGNNNYHAEKQALEEVNNIPEEHLLFTPTFQAEEEFTETDETTNDSLTCLSENEENKEPVVMPEEMPEFVGGKPQLQFFLKQNLIYPQKSFEKGVEGTVFITFVINEDGGVDDISVLKGLNLECDEEALRVVSRMPHWKPGKKEGKIVKVKFNLPIRFQISQ